MKNLRTIGLATAIFTFSQACTAPTVTEPVRWTQSADSTSDTSNVDITAADGTTTQYVMSRSDVNADGTSTQDNGDGTYSALADGVSYLITDIVQSQDGSATARVLTDGVSTIIRVENVANLAPSNRVSTSSVRPQFIIVLLAVAVVAAILVGACIRQDQNMATLCAELNAQNTDPTVHYFTAGPACARTCTAQRITPPTPDAGTGCCCGAGCACSSCPRSPE